jgi:hypothetical protein
MSAVQRFRDLPEWQEFGRRMKDHGVDPNVIAEIEEIEGDPLDFVEMTIALEEAFGWNLDLRHKVDLGGRGK